MNQIQILCSKLNQVTIFYSGHTKTEKVVTSVLAQYSIDAVRKSFEENDIAYFGVATDGSNHNKLKLFPIIIQYFDWRKGGLQSKLIEFTNKANETADTIATNVKDTFEKMSGIYKRQLQYLFGGIRRNEQGNNVFTKLKKMLNPSLIRVGCSAHVLTNYIHHEAERINIGIEKNIHKI